MCNINLKNDKTMKQIIFIIISLVCLCSCSNKTENKTTQPKKHSKKKFTILALLAGAIALPIYLVKKA